MTTNNNQPEENTPTFTKGQEVWVKAIIESPDPDCYGCIKFRRRNQWGMVYGFVHPSEIRTTEQIVQEHGDSTPQKNILTETDRTRRFKKGDKVRLVERDGRPPVILDKLSYQINNIYEVVRDEVDSSFEHGYSIELKNTDPDILNECFPFYNLDLVKPAPEPKYWLHESQKTYSIYYKGQFGRVITAMLMQKDLYTLEEAQEECDRLNRKEEEND